MKRKLWAFICAFLFISSMLVYAHANSDWACAQCGVNNSLDFCRACGAPRPNQTAVQCHHCHATIASAEYYQFCPACGNTLSVPLSNVYCLGCGKQLLDASAKSCDNCGTPIGIAPTAVPTAAPTAVPAPPAVSGLPEMPSSPLFYTYDVQTRYFYQQLTAHEKQLFSILYDCIASFQTTVDIPDGFYNSDLERVEWVLRTNCPELIHYDNRKISYSRPLDDSLTRWEPDYYLSAAEFQSQWSSIMNQIQSIQSFPGFGASDYSKQRTIYRYILEHCYYQIDEPYTINANAVFVYGRAQCVGYAEALSLAMRYYGIPNISVTGYVYKDGVRDDLGHVWTLALIDGQWYQSDATWDDPTWKKDAHPAPFADNGNGYIRYLNIPESRMMADRTYSILRNDGSEPPIPFALPAAVSYDANYAYMEGIFVPAGQPNVTQYVRERLIALRDMGYASVMTYFADINDYRTCYAEINNIFKNLRNASDYHYWYSEDAGTIYFDLP